MDFIQPIPLEVLHQLLEELQWPDRLALKLTSRYHFNTIETTFLHRLDWLLTREEHGLPVPRLSCNLSSDKQLCENTELSHILREERRKGRGVESCPGNVLSVHSFAQSSAQWWVRGISGIPAHRTDDRNLCYAIIQNWKRRDALLDVVIAKDPSRGVDVSSYEIQTMSQFTQVTAFLHVSQGNNEFRICTWRSIGCFVAKSLLDRIPLEFRPAINPKARTEVPTLFGSISIQAIGSAVVPFYVVDRESVRFHFAVTCLVFEKFEIDMLVPAKYFETLFSSCIYGGGPKWCLRYAEPVEMLAVQEGICKGAR